MTLAVGKEPAQINFIKMRILVITFTGDLNPGTYMQALGVKTALLRIWPHADVDFLNFPDFKRGNGFGPRGKKDTIWNTILQKGYAAYRLLRYNKLRSNNFHYTQNIDLFQYSERDVDILKKYDLVVIGSDTILEQAFGDDGRIGLNWMPLDIPKIYFAASASPANYKGTRELKNVAEKASFIGLRDDLTINFFNQELGIELSRIVKQPDPSYFLDVDSLDITDGMRKHLRSKEKYALYNFNSDFPLRKELADAIRSCGYKVVTTAYNPYSDICFAKVNALEWAGLFKYMDVIVTERFHDSVFGLRNCKPVVAIDWDPNRFSSNGDSKTFRILQDYGMEQLHFNLANDSQLDKVVNCIKNVMDIFDKNKLETVNQKFYERNESILEQIKRSLK